MPFEDRRSFGVQAVRGAAEDRALATARAVFRGLAPFYGLGLRFRSWLCASSALRTRRLPVPAISVGNLTAGGTGKTPMVEWVVERIRQWGQRPAVLSRGYGAPRKGAANDEAAVLDKNLGGVIHVIDGDRARGGWEAVEKWDADCVVLDDGFQHVRLARDLDIVLIDALDPFGGGRLLPAGALREPMSALGRAHVVVLTRADLISHEERESLMERVQGLAPDAVMAEAGLDLLGLDPLVPDIPQAPDWVAHKRVFAFCGLGNPLGFVRRLERLRPAALDGVLLDDHTPYPQETIDGLAREAEQAGAEVVVTTQKDAVKIGEVWPGPVPAFALRIRLKIMAGEEGLVERLRDVLHVG